MFTISDIRDIAVQIERNGQSAYRKASRMVQDDSLAEMLFQMADDEKQHEQFFQSLGSCSTKEGKGDLQQLESVGRALLQDMMQDQTFSLDAKSLADQNTELKIVSRSLEFENDTILFYELLSDFIDDPDTVRHLQAIISEERQHASILEDRKKRMIDGV